MNPKLIASALVLLTLSTGCKIFVRKVSTEGDNAVANYPGDGGTVLAINSENADYICSMPPAQGVKLLEQALAAKGTVATPGGEAVEGEFSSTHTETLAKLYEQSERTLFLQFAFYRLCEAHANDMIRGTCDPHLDRYNRIRDQKVQPIGAPAQKQSIAVAWKDYTTCMKSCETLRTSLKPAEKLEGETRKDVATQVKVLAGIDATRAKHQAYFDLDDYESALRLEAAAATYPEVKTELEKRLGQAIAAKKKLTDPGDSVRSQVNGRKGALTELDRRRTLHTTALEGLAKAQGMLNSCRSELSGNYATRFKHVIEAAKDLHELEVEKAKAEAEKAKADAAKAAADAPVNKAKAEAEKAKADAEKAVTELEKVRVDSVNAVIEAAKKPASKDEKPKED